MSAFVNGADFSDYQPDVDFATFKDAGYSFAYSKATEGTGYAATTYASNIAAGRSAGLLVGAYHFFHFDEDPVEQANFFLSAAKPGKGDLPPALDLEQATTLSPALCVASIAKFLGVVEAATKRRCLIYLDYYFWQGTLQGTDGFSGHPLWLAQYTTGPRPQMIPAVWKDWTFWQYSGNKTIPGVPEPVDADMFNGSLDALKALTLP